MNAFFCPQMITDDPNDPIRVLAKEYLGEDMTEEKVLGYTFFMRKGTEHEQENRIKLLREREKQLAIK